MTFQARDLAESRHLYDHLAVLSPIMLALTAATPVLPSKSGPLMLATREGTLGGAADKADIDSVSSE